MKKQIFFLLIFSCLVITSWAQSWSLTGNSGTNPNTNFLGTTDSKSLVFRTNNIERMRIKNSSLGIGVTSPAQKLDVNGNINIGKGFALYMDNHPVFRVDSVNENIFLGNGSGFSNAGSFYNTAVGYQTLNLTTSGSFNTAVGTQALRFNTWGGYNTATGVNALHSNNTGSDNTATGVSALYYNTTGSANVATGESALSSNTTGYNNDAHGYRALYSNNNGGDNAAYGYATLYKNTSGSYNTALGDAALYSNTTASYNTATGYHALYSNTTGAYNTASGIEALLYNSTGSFNTAMGTDALFNNTASYYNCAYGYLAMAYAIPGYNNVAVGSFAGPAVDFDDLYNTISIGTSAVTTASNQARIGNSSTTSIGGYTNWSNISDGRVKKNIKANVPGLSFINKLKAVTYNLDLDVADRITQNVTRKDKQGKAIAPLQQETNARNVKQQIVYTGFVAQDVEKVAKELNYDFSGVDAAKNDRDLYGLRYAEFVVPLVKAVQELSKENDELKSTLSDVLSQLADVKKQLGELKAGQSSTSTLQSNVANDAAHLEQNTPNPFANTTAIHYNLPHKFTTAQIVITDKNGRTIKQMNVSGAGRGTANIDASMLSAGTYNYSLIIDGKRIGAKQMVLTK